MVSLSVRAGTLVQLTATRGCVVGATRYWPTTIESEGRGKTARLAIVLQPLPGTRLGSAGIRGALERAVPGWGLRSKLEVSDDFDNWQRALARVGRLSCWLG